MVIRVPKFPVRSVHFTVIMLIPMGVLLFVFSNLKRPIASIMEHRNVVYDSLVVAGSQMAVSHDELPSLTENLPLWLQEYAQWHKAARAQLNETNWRVGPNSRFLIMSAKRSPVHAGGVTDRLRPLPYYLKVAASTRRILLIYWSRPFACEHYLLPPEGGLDWRLPHYMADEVEKNRIVRSRDVVANKANSEDTLVLGQIQDYRYGEDYYDNHPLEGDLDETKHPNATVAERRIAITRDIWNLVFTPSPPIAERITQEYDRMGIAPAGYASAHIRSVHAVDSRSDEETQSFAQRAMDCASMMRPGGPFFVAADTALAVDAALDYGRTHNVTVVAATIYAQDGGSVYQKGPFHLDLYNWTDASVVPEDLYDTFVDLYLLGNTNCVSFGPGSFGRWGYLIGYNSTCSANWSREKCKWTDPDPNTTNNRAGNDDASYPSGTRDQLKFTRPLFRRPMNYDTIYSF